MDSARSSTVLHGEGSGALGTHSLAALWHSMLFLGFFEMIFEKRCGV